MNGAVTVSGVLPRYIYSYSDALNVQTRQTVAFQASCKCGWSGKWRDRRLDACDDYQAHKQRKHGGAQ